MRPGSPPAGPRAAVPVRAIPWILAALFGIVLARTAWVCDDAFITLRVADNWLHGFGPRWNVVERVQVCTHPLWLLLVTLSHAALRDPFASVLALAVPCSVATFVWITKLAEPSPARMALVALLLLGSRAFVDFSTGGLENPLQNLVLVAFAAGLMGNRSVRILALLTGALLWTRLDSALLVLPAWILLVRRDRRAWRHLALGLLPLAAWLAWATFYYGHPLPNTFLAKLATGVPRADLLRQGIAFLAACTREDPVTTLLLLLGIGIAVWKGNATARALAAGIALHLAYVVWIGGDFMVGRFLAAPFAVAACLAAETRARPAHLGGVALAILAAIVFTPHRSLTSGRDFGIPLVRRVDANGIADERRYWFGTAGLLSDAPRGRRPTYDGRWIGDAARASRLPLLAEGGVGFVGYFAGPGTYVLDLHALGDPLLARLPSGSDDPAYAAFLSSEGTGPPRGRWRIGHFPRVVPPGYLASLATGENRIVDPALHALYDRIRLVTRGPLLGASRLAAIPRFWLEQGKGIPQRGPLPPLDWDEVLAADSTDAEAWFQRGDPARALASNPQHVRALASNPQHVRALELLADDRLRAGDAAGAEALSRRVAALVPESVTNRLRLARLEIQSGRDAQGVLEALTRDAPRQITPLLLLAATRRQRGDLDGARALIDRALLLRPGDPDALAVRRMLLGS